MPTPTPGQTPQTEAKKSNKQKGTDMAFGRLERSAAPQPMSDINITPLVDVMLVLVVIFLLTAPLLASAIRLDLPRADGSTPGAAPASVTVVLDPTGQVFVNDQPLDEAALVQRFTALAAQSRATEVQLRADAAVPYGRVVQVLGAAQQAGLSRIGFVTEPTSTAAPAGAVPAARATAPR